MKKTTSTSDTTSFSSSDSSIEREHENPSALSHLSESDTSLSFPLSLTPEHEKSASFFSARPITSESEGHLSFSSDSPITSNEHDTLGRAGFAQRLANTIAIRKDPSCLTIGLYGAWGSGKTSMLKMIKEELKKRTEKKTDARSMREKIDSGSSLRVISKSCEKNEYASSISVMDFNPWFFRSEEALLQNFLSELSHTIEAQFTNTAKKIIGKLLKNYADVLTVATAPVLPPPFNQLSGIAAKEAGEKLSSTSITKIKKDIEEALRKNKKKTIIFIDDIDRLDKEEIHALFKIIRLSADFPYVTYVLAFDYAVVTASLQERYCADQEKNAGEAFLEKIIQVPLHVPLPAESMFHDVIYKRLNEVILQTETALNSDQKNRFFQCFALGILPKITTLRLSNLYCNALLFSLPLLKEEVCAADLMLIEGIRLFYPKLYDDIRKNFYTHLIKNSEGWISIKNGNEKEEEEEEEEEKAIEAFFEHNLSKETLKEARHIKETLLLELFPSIGEFDEDKAWYREKRICSIHYFPKYFMYAVPLDDISDYKIDSFLALLSKNEEKNATRLFQTMVESSSILVVLGKCILWLDTLSEKQTTSFLDFILCNLSLIEKYFRASLEGYFFDSLHVLLTELFEKIDEESKNEFFLKLAQDSEPLSFVILFFWEQRWIREQKEDSSVNSHYKEALSVLARRIKERDEESPLYTQQEINTRAAYTILQKEFGHDALNDYLKLRFDTSPDHVDLFLKNLLGWKDLSTTQWSKNEYFDSPLFFNFFKYFLDPQYIADNLTHRFGEKLTNNYEATDEREAFSLSIAKNFMTWYTTLQNNKGYGLLQSRKIK